MNKLLVSIGIVVLVIVLVVVIMTKYATAPSDAVVSVSPIVVPTR